MTIPSTDFSGAGRVSWGPEGGNHGGDGPSLSNHQQVLAAIRRNLSLSPKTGNCGVGLAAERELKSLAEETDPQIFYSDLLHWARVRQQEGQTAPAVRVYETLSGEISEPQEILAVPEAVQERAINHLTVIRGGGSWGERLEFQGEQFFEGVLSPSVILGMAVGSTVFTGTRSLLLPRLWGSSARNFLTSGWGARLTASTLALGTESMAFWGVSKSLEEYFHPGSQRWDLATNLQEITSLMMTLGLLRGSGFIFRRSHQWAVQVSHSSGASQISQALLGKSSAMWHQGGMLTGILMSHGLEQKLGRRVPQTFDAILLDSLVTLVQFNAAGALSHRVFPKLYARNAQQERRLQHQEQNQWKGWMEEIPRFPMGEGRRPWGYQWAPAGSYGFSPSLFRPGKPRPKAWDSYFFSSSLNNGEGSSGPQRPRTFRQLMRQVQVISDPQDAVEALSLLYISTVGELRPSIFESLVAVREGQITPGVAVGAMLKNPRIAQMDFFSHEIRQKVSDRFEFLAHREGIPKVGRLRQPTPVDQPEIPKANLSNLNVSELLLRLHRMRLEEFSQALQSDNLSISQKDAARELAVLARYFDQAVAKHERQAETDFLTGLLNKRGLDRVTPRLENRLQAYREFTAGEKKADWVLMIDIDHFKKVNDTYGHPNGDEVLRTVAQTLRNSVRFRDITARVGGEEFFILLAKAGREGAARVAESLRQAVSVKSISLTGFDPIQVTISVGAAPMRLIRSPVEPGEWIMEGALMDAKERADRALYEAKSSGRNRVRVSREGRIPWPQLRQRPTLARFRRLLAEVTIPPEELAMELNWKFNPKINLSQFSSYSGRPIYISDKIDVEKLRHYGRLDYQSLGEMVFFARKDLSRNWNLTEAALPNRLNIRRERLSAIERNQKRPTEEELERMADILDLEIESLREARNRTRFRRRLKSQF